MDYKGPVDRALFTHPDRQRAVKNCTIFPLKSLLIPRSNVFTAASLFLFSSFPMRCVELCVRACVCILSPTPHTPQFFFTQYEQKQKTKTRCQLSEAQGDGEERVPSLFHKLLPLPLLSCIHPTTTKAATPLLLRHLVVIICLCKSLSMIYRVISLPPPREMLLLAFWGLFN